MHVILLEGYFGHFTISETQNQCNFVWVKILFDFWLENRFTASEILRENCCVGRVKSRRFVWVKFSRVFPGLIVNYCSIPVGMED